MNRDNAVIVAGLVDRITKLEETIFKLQQIANMTSYKIIPFDKVNKTSTDISVDLNEGDIATVVFNQDILQYFIDILNLELNELIKTLEDF